MSRLLASATGAKRKLDLRARIDRYATAGEHPSDEIDFDSIKPPDLHNDAVLTKELSSFDEPAIISARLAMRPPMPYFTLINSDGIAYQSYVCRTPLAPLMAMLSTPGNMLTYGDYCVFRLLDGRRIRIDFTEGPEDRMLKSIDFSLEGKSEDKTLPLARQFLAILKDCHLIGEVFKKNPYFDQEKLAYKRWHSNPTVFDPPKVSLKSLLVEPWNWDVLIIPDIHNRWDELELIEELLDRGRIDWIAAEMFRVSHQPIIDRYLAVPGGTNSYVDLRRKLEELTVEHEKFQQVSRKPAVRKSLWKGLGRLKKDLSVAWDSWLGYKGSQGPYMKMLLECRERDMRLIGLNCERDYVLINYDTRERVPWIMGGENSLWAERVPKEGRGIVFGGLMHFTRFPGVRVQDFLADLQPNRNIVMASFI